MNTTTKPRRSGAKIMAQLIVLLGSLVYIMLLAVINGTAGFLCAMGVTLSGAAAIAKALGEEISFSYGALIALAVGCGVLRGLLRFAEQYGNHYIAFRLLAVLRDKIFTALRRLCPAKLETRQKGAIIAMITSDIETLEVFYAHTISPICIAVLLSVGMTVFIGCVSSWYLARRRGMLPSAFLSRSYSPGVCASRDRPTARSFLRSARISSTVSAAFGTLYSIMRARSAPRKLAGVRRCFSLRRRK